MSDRPAPNAEATDDDRGSGTAPVDREGERARIRELLARVPNLGVVQVPLLSDDVHDLPGLRRLGQHLFA